LVKLSSNEKPKALLLWENDIPDYMRDDTSIFKKIKAMEKELPLFFRPVLKKLLETNYAMKPKLRPFALKNGRPNPAVIIIPGGSYASRADVLEGTDAAKWLNDIGVSAFVLDYRCAPYEYPVPLLDAKRALRYVRHNAEQFGIDPRRVGVMGFSAGGHLASTLGTKFDSGDPEAVDPIERQSCRPDLLVLCYPVITMGEYTHALSRIDLLGINPDKNKIELLSNEKQVGKETPPTFIWHTKTDEAVPVENTYLFVEALQKADIPHETHIFPRGKHGLGLALKRTDEASRWTKFCEKWLKEQWK
jgi:acetyl esterase/lipase